MNKYIKYFLVCMSFIIGSDVMAQKTFQPKATQFDWKGIIYRKEKLAEIRLHTNGLLIGYNIGEIKTYHKTKYYHFSLGILKDPREKRNNKNESFNFPRKSRSFAFGKQNSVFNLRVGLGMRKYISEKAERKGIAIGYDYNIGPTLALLKPYYLELKYVTGDTNPLNRIIRTEKYTEENAEKFLTHDEIFGGAPYFKGFGEMSVVPGIHGKLGLFFAMGAFSEYAKSIETGIMVDVYAKKLPIMVETKEISNKPYFINFYLNFTFGKRKY